MDKKPFIVGEKKMKKKILSGSLYFFVVSALIISNCTTFIAASIPPPYKEEPQLQYSITTNIQNVTSIFQFIWIKVTMKNLGNESVSLNIGGYPGGQFSIFDDKGKFINMNPKFFLTLYWGITLEPEEEYVLYQGVWYQHTIYGRFVRNGDYHLYGGTAVIYYHDQPITPDPFGPVNIIIARRFLP